MDMSHQRKQLEELLCQSIEILENEDCIESKTILDNLLEDHQDLAPQIRKALDRLGLLGLVGPLPKEEANLPENLGEFERGTPLGGGGMGLVFRAHQPSLDREVALKLIRPEQALLPRARERFRREASTIASMSHPGIIKVHAFGEQQGVPFIAMDLIHGCTLAEALEVLKGKKPGELRGKDLFLAIQEATLKRFPEKHFSEGEETLPEIYQSSWVRACQGIIKAAGKALAYTHRQGLVHRDVKPSNLMLTADGQVLLFDFGLTSTPHDSSLTRSGSPLGSPAYMAPEIIRGKEADVRADIYGLGISLFEILTLERPFHAPSLASLQHHILDAAPLPPRKFNPKIPKDLETVCLHAMDPDSLHRYPSMDAFVEDLERLERNETILAKRPSPLLRLLRWRKRHPTLSTAFFFLALIGVGTPTSLWLSQRSANLKIMSARDLAEKNLEMALSAVEQFLASWGRNQIQNNPLLEDIGKKLLERGVNLYSHYLEETSSDPRVLGRRGKAGVVLSDLYLRQGKLTQAKAAIQEALRAFDQIPQAKEWRLSEASGRITYSRILRKENHIEPAKKELRKALALLPDQDLSKEQLALRGSAFGDLGAIAFDSSELRLAEKNYKIYQQIFTHLERYDPKFRIEKGLALHRLGLVARQLGKRQEAIQRFEETTSLFKKLHKEIPWEFNIRIQLAETLLQLGRLKGWGREKKASKQIFEESRRLLLELKKDFPKNLDIKNRLGQALSMEASFLETAGEDQLALQRYEEANKEYSEMGSALFKNHNFLTGLLSHRARYGFLLTQKRKLKEASDLLKETLSIAESSIQEVGFREKSIISKIQMTLAILLRRQGILGEAEKMGLQVIETRKALLQIHPKNKGLMTSLGIAFHNLANIRRERGHPQEAIRLIQQAIRWKRPALKNPPSSHGRAHSLGLSLQDLSLDLYKQGRHEEAIKSIKEAVQLHQRAFLLRPQNPRYRGWLDEAKKLQKTFSQHLTLDPSPSKKSDKKH
jgi:serine/threonine protein kinase